MSDKSDNIIELYSPDTIDSVLKKVGNKINRKGKEIRTGEQLIKLLEDIGEKLKKKKEHLFKAQSKESIFLDNSVKWHMDTFNLDKFIEYDENILTEYFYRLFSQIIAMWEMRENAYYDQYFRLKDKLDELGAE